METWQEDLLLSFGRTESQQELFGKIEAAAVALGFDYCAYGLRMPLPLSNPKTVIVTSYPRAWQRRYHEAEYVNTDPTVAHGLRSRAPVLWSNRVFEAAPQLWHEAKAFGLRCGWAQSSISDGGIVGMLTLARGSMTLAQRELSSLEARMRWLVNLSHQSLAPLLAPALGLDRRPSLTGREAEVLKWTGDGKTSSEISDILCVSENTVNFHVKNAVSKFGCTNKTAAVVRAAMLGLLRRRATIS
jgi:LuxR family transcriptional regulator, quorum-sensing system regulator SolR